MLSGMGDATLQTDLGRVLVTGGSGFVGANLVAELLEQGHEVRSFDRAPSPLPEHPRLQVLQGDICDKQTVANAVDGIDTVSGSAQYTVDVVLPGTLRVKLLRSPLPHARIRRVDSSRARALAGGSLGELQGPREPLAARHHHVHQADPLGRRCIDALPEQDHALGP